MFDALEEIDLRREEVDDGLCGSDDPMLNIGPIEIIHDCEMLRLLPHIDTFSHLFTVNLCSGVFVLLSIKSEVRWGRPHVKMTS